jgi:hypothetical protein
MVTPLSGFTEAVLVGSEKNWPPGVHEAPESKVFQVTPPCVQLCVNRCAA